jgi:hypothetical protein
MTGRHRSTFRTIERDAYLADRSALDVRAAARGPAPLARRLIRRKVTRTGFSLLRGLLR